MENMDEKITSLLEMAPVGRQKLHQEAEKSAQVRILTSHSTFHTGLKSPNTLAFLAIRLNGIHDMKQTYQECDGCGSFPTIINLVVQVKEHEKFKAQ